MKRMKFEFLSNGKWTTIYLNKWERKLIGLSKWCHHHHGNTNGDSLMNILRAWGIRPICIDTSPPSILFTNREMMHLINGRLQFVGVKEFDKNKFYFTYPMRKLLKMGRNND